MNTMKKFKPQVTIKMTDDQMEQLQKLFDKCRKNPNKYAVIGQVIGGVGKFSAVTPEQLIERAEKIKLQRGFDYTA